jgi:hypothetical protein
MHGTWGRHHPPLPWINRHVDSSLKGFGAVLYLPALFERDSEPAGEASRPSLASA